MDWKKFLFFALIPALLTGLAAVAPKIYEVFTTPKADLSYIQTDGLEIESPTNIQKVVSIQIFNNGKLPLTKLIAELNSADGMVAAYKVEENSGLHPKVDHQKNKISFSIDKMLPSEHVSLSLLLTGSSHNLKSDLILRSDEVLGYKIIEDANKKSNNSSFISFLLTISTVLITALVFFKNRNGIIKTIFSERSDLIFYIAEKINIPELTIQIYNNDITYLRFADLLCHFGKISDNYKEKSILGLKCLLLIKDMADLSNQVVISNLKKISGNAIGDDEISKIKEKSVPMNKLLEFRHIVDNL
jgi:hypothetical protein